MSELTNIAARIALLQSKLSLNLAELAAAERSGVNNLVLEAKRATILRQQAELAELQTQLAQAQQRAALGTASAGNLARDDQQATVPASRPQSPQSDPQVLTPDGRIQTVPDTTTATTATPAVTVNSEDSGTNAPVRPITQTQATPAYGPGLLLDPGDVEAQEGGYYGGGGPPTPPASTQPGFGAGGEEASPRNATRVEIDNIFTETQITPQPNVLDQYASYTYTASVYLLPAAQYKTMMETKQRTLTGGQLLFQSGGAPTGGRNQFFSLDYYIDKFEIKSFILGKGTGLTHNAKEINMTVVEPNGITLIDNLTRAVQGIMPEGEKKKSITSAVYLLIIRFYGYDSQGNLVRGGISRNTDTTDTGAFIEKWFPFIIKDIKFRVANKTVEYDISAAAPQFQINAGQARGTIPFNIELSGQTIKDLLSGPAQYTTNQNAVAAGGNGLNIVNDDDGNPLPAPAKADAAPTTKTTVRQGLMAALNQHQLDLQASRPGYVADEYSIEFVGAGNGPTAIEQARLRPPGGLDKKGTSNPTPGTAADAKLSNKQSMDPNSRNQSATAGMQIVQFLDQVLRNSTYLKDQQLVIIDPATQEEKYNGTPAQNVAWFKISLDAQAKLDAPFDTVRNQYAYKIKYIISPYKISDLESKYFPRPRFTGVQKEYKYWFTGENTSVLSYEENINGLYYLTLSGAGVNLTGTYLNQEGEKVNYNFQTASTESSQGADGKVNEPVANASEYLFQPGALKEANITIVGDPAWLQQGEGSLGQLRRNWNFGSFLPDGTLNFDGGQILFRIAFNAPADYDSSTGIVRPGLASSQAVGPGQGAPNGPAQINRVYIAHTCISSFNRGRFTQQLIGALKLNQSTNDNTAAQALRLGQQQQGIAAMSTTRALSLPANSALSPTLGTVQETVATTAYVPPVLQNTFGQGLRVPAGLANTPFNTVLGGQATRPVNLPGAPTSFGLPVGFFDSGTPLRLPGAVTDFSQTINDSVAGTQRSIRGVVDSVSNGVTQTVAAGDDSGTDLISSPIAETEYRSPEDSLLITEATAEFGANNDLFG
jgi:hypothetical protein